MSLQLGIAEGYGTNETACGTALDVELCPICECSGAQEWLRGPDRFHGRLQAYTLLRCTNCSLVWLATPPRPNEMDIHYGADYDRLISQAGENSPMRWRARNEALAQFKQRGTLLDLGCSSGAFLKSLKKEAWQLFGVEMSAESAQLAREATGAEVFVGDILEAPFPPESFDVITCFDVLEHVHDPRGVMRSVARWLKPGGIFYVLVPNIDSAEARVFGSYWHGLELPRHLSHFSPTSLRNLAKTVDLSEASLVTRRNPAVGTSLRYVFDDFFRTVGIRRVPIAYKHEASFAWRAGRKVVRMTVLRALLVMAPLAGGGESIHGFFVKGNRISC